MAVDFTIAGVVDVFAQTLCGGSTVIAGLLIMLGVYLAILAVFAAAKAPLEYSLVPLIIVDIAFAAMGIIDYTLSMLVLIITAVLVAGRVRDMVVGGRSRCWVLPAAAMIPCR